MNAPRQPAAAASDAWGFGGKLSRTPKIRPQVGAERKKPSHMALRRRFGALGPSRRIGRG
jgi:hypothetical protein